MDWFSFKGQLNRTNFIVRLLSIWLVSAIPFYFSSAVIENHLGIKGYLLSKSFVEVFIVLLCLPSIIKRLRDINWSIYLSGLFLVSCVFSIRNFILFSLPLSSIQFYLIMAISITSLVLLLFLIFKSAYTNSIEE